jgi:hypothetical protein
MDKSELAVHGAAAAPVTKEEIKRLILEAQTAWRRQSELGLTEEPFEAWRHGSLYDCCRKSSFRALGQHEFGLALAYFEKLAGREPNTRWGHTNHAIAQRESTGEGDLNRAMFKLREACGELADIFGGYENAMNYSHVLMHLIHKCTMRQATAKQVWQVMFTLRSRAKARAKKLAAGADVLKP